MSDTDRKVLMVDDEPFIRQSFVDYFEDNMWQTLEAESGEQALEILKNETVPCAIVDIRMRGMDGNAFIRAANAIAPRMSFVICTGSPEYLIPEDILSMPNVSKQLFRKPVADLAELEAELLRIAKKVQ